MPYDSDRACSSTKNNWPETTTQHIQTINHGGIIETTRGFANAAPSQHFGEPLIRRQVRTLDPKNSITDLRDLHPLPSQIPYIWEVYIMNVDPILKVVHIPSTNEDIRNIVRDPTRVVPETEALLFAIYYAAIISMEVHDVSMDFGVEKSHLLEKFRYGVEQALVKVDFLNNSALSVIQALTLFLVMAYRFEDRRFPCALMSLLIRLNQSLGLYGGGFHSSAVSLLEMEIYRRLWWTASTLDLSYAERDGTELIIDPRACHPEYPLNIGDEDISPDMKSFSCSRDGVTGMAFIIAQYQICSLARRTRQSAGQETPGPLDANPRIQALKELLYTGYKPLGEGLCIPYADHYEECHCGTDHAIIDRFTQAAMCLAAYQSMRLSAAEQDVNKVRDLLLSPSIEVVECIALFHTEPKYKRFHWALRSSEYLQAIGYLAIEICQGPSSMRTLRAHGALKTILHDTILWKYIKVSQHTTLGILLRRLMAKTKRTTKLQDGSPEIENGSSLSQARMLSDFLQETIIPECRAIVAGCPPTQNHDTSWVGSDTCCSTTAESVAPSFSMIPTPALSAMQMQTSCSDHANAPPTSHVDNSPITDDLSSNIMATKVRVFEQPQSHNYASAYGDGFLQTSSQTTASADDTTPFLLTRPEFRLEVGSNPEITANTSFSPSF
ncbi:hypothetical protein SUNI508_13894 [Seiridium unicorne]|uniref:Xylanolytic transcriptional activator regulatory domain-containing protein n=1 Tax=Seiridium unicorne TaxID=138068 RepID=A0ABR2VBV7_9PEZI